MFRFGLTYYILGVYFYFPMQNLLKMFPNKSSVEMSPVIIPSSYIACRMSIAIKSEVIPDEIPSFAFSKDNVKKATPVCN